MANLKSFTGFLALDVLGQQSVAPGLSFTLPGSNPLDIIIQDGDSLLQGDTTVDDQSADPQGDQIGFVTNSDGEALLDGQEIFVETSFTFTLNGAGSFTGYVLENEGSGQSFVVLPPNLATGTVAITSTDDNATDIDYADLGSGDEEISQNDFANLDLTGSDTIEGGDGDDTIDAGEGDDSVLAGDGDDTAFGNAGGDTVDGGAGDDSIRGDSGEDGITAVRESFNWAQLGLSSGQTVPNNANGIDQDTGNITVNLDYVELARFDDFEYRDNFAQNTAGIDTGGETIGNDIGFLVGDGTSPPGDTVEVDFSFSANTAGFEDEVRNVQFRINDVDDLNWRDVLEIRAFDANGDAVHVVLTGGSNITLTDTDGVNGFDTAIANNTNTNNNPIDASNSLLVEVPGPVARINIVYGNQETAGQRVDVTDIFFDAVPTAIANVEAGDDSLLGGSGDDTIFGEAGEDTIDGGTDDDSVEGGANDDLLVINDNFGNDTITGGEIGETTGDTLDGGALTEAVNVVYSGDEAGDAANSVTGDSASFSEIEHINTGSGDDTIDGTLDTVGIDLNAGAGADTILGGQAGDTLNAGSGADTIDGQAGDDTINAGDDADEIRLTDGFDNDSIIGGEGGDDSDTVSGATLTEDVVVTYDGDEFGNFVGQTSGDNAAFDEIEGVTTGSGDDTVNASADSTGQTITTNAGTDTILGGAGGDTIDAGTGADTISGGDGADSITGGDDQDLINLTGNFGDDTIAGGEGGTDGDTLDGSTLTEDINVLFDGDESGAFTGQTTGSDATFSEIEVINTGSGDDTIDASADSVGTTINTGAGADTVLGGAGGDTLTTGTGDDTVDGGLGADSINAGDGDDELRINDQFGDDTIIGGEGGETTGDTLAGGGLTEDVTVTFNNDGESGTVTNPGGDSANFAEIEAVETGSGDDTIDASGSPVGVNVDSGAGDDTITGGTGDDTFAAGAGDDTIAAGQGDDSIIGGDGDDDIQLTDNFGDDTIVGGEGAENDGGDEIDASAVTEPVTVLFDGDEQGTISGDNTGDQANFEEIEEITTGSGDDTVDATADTVGVTINTGAGDDTVLGGQGGDTLNTGTGQDTVNGGAGADSINAGDDEDSIVLTDGFGDDTIAGGEGGNDDDTLAGGALTEAVTVTFNADDESGTVTNPGGDTATFSEIEAVETGSGDDTIDGSASTGGINVDSGAGDDTMSGGAGDDTLAAGDGADTVNGGLGADSITGGDGDDELQITDVFGDDTIVGGEGGETNGDTLAGGGLTENVEVIFNADGESGTVTNPGGDTANFAEIEAVETGSGDDTIDASGSPVGVNANSGAGDDTITGGTGDDTLSGGAGVDTIDGGAGADSIDGGAGDDSLQGGAGDDTIVGGDGADTIDGGEDDDFLTGGDEDDLFIYMAGQGDDTISDFNFGNTGALGDGDPTNNDFIDLTDFYTNLTEARADIADDGILNQSVGDFTDNTLLDGSLTLAGITPGGLTTDNTGLANQAGNFPHIVQGADGGAGLNQDGDNIFDDGRFYVEFIDNTGPTSVLADLGFDTLDGSLGTAVPYNAGTTDNLDIAAQTGTFGNDGEEYGARVTTTLDVAAGGTYTFTTTSDDGSILFINGTQVVNNDGLHATQTQSGTIDLDPGQYEITVLFFENSGADNLSATISGPDTGNTPLSLNDPAVNIRANAGAETVSGGAGDDTFQAGAGDDVLFGDEDQDLFVMTNGFDSDTITGGEGGTDSDSIDGSALSNGVNVVYSGDEAGTFSDPFDTAVFSEIENLTLTALNDTLDASADTVGVNVLAGAGDDSLLGGTGGDTIAGGAGQDTLAGETGADSLTGGDDQDTFILNDQFGDDTIVGGEGGVDSDTLDGSALTEDVSVLFDGDEQGNVTNPGGDNADFSEIEAIRTGSGDDTIDASADTVGTDVDSGAGDDTITGGAGDDTLAAGAGEDTVDGGEGADSVAGGDGDDLINLTGIFGDDTIVGGEAGETNGDTVSGSTLTEDVIVTFDGDEQGDFVSQDGNGSANFEEIEAVETGLGDDTVDATLDTLGTTIITNEGEDVIIGGAGDDSIDAGDDDDTITFGQNDTALGGDGADEFIIQPTTDAMTVIGDFDPSTNVDNTIIYDEDNLPDQTDNDFVDLSSFFANINELRDANTPNGDGDVVLDLGDGQTLTFVGVSDVTLLNFENTNVICFTRGAKIRTAQGDVAVEDLVAGDMVETMDSGPQPIRWIGRRIISAGLLDATPRLRPVRIIKGALGASRDLMVSPQHRMLLTGDRAEMMFGADQVLAAAKDLIDGDMIHMGPADDVEYFHILFDDHEIIFAEDVPTESFHPGEQALNTTTAKMQAEIFELFPELAEEVVTRPTARMVLKSHEAKAFVRQSAAHSLV